MTPETVDRVFDALERAVVTVALVAAVLVGLTALGALLLRLVG